jgi:hypothetical protein
MLFAAYVLDTLKGMLIDESDYDEDETPEMWGMLIKRKTFDRMMSEMIDEFMLCIESRAPIRIAGNGYTIRHSSKVSRKLLQSVFSFRLVDDSYVIDPNGVNLDTDGSTFSDRKEELMANKMMVRKIVYAVEHDDNWDGLTDAEAAVYCWHINMKRKNPLNEKEWQGKYEPHHSMSLPEIKTLCAKGELDGHYCFSKKLVDAWNKSEEWDSIIDSIPDDDANEFWFSS